MGLDRIIEFIVVCVLVGILVSLTRWILFGAFVVLGIVLTIGTFRPNGYGFKDIAKDYAAFIYDIRHDSNMDNHTFVFSNNSNVRRQNEKRQLRKAIHESDQKVVKQFANRCCLKNPFRDYAEDEYEDNCRVIIHALAICEEINSHWCYVDDPKDNEYFSIASETIQQYMDERKTSGSACFTGDCDDHTIVMCACIKAIGGTSMMVRTESQIYPMLYIGDNSVVKKIRYLLHEIYDTDDIHFYEVNPDEYWINLDFYSVHHRYPGKAVREQEQKVIYFEKI